MEAIGQQIASAGVAKGGIPAAKQGLKLRSVSTRDGDNTVTHGRAP